MSTKTLYRRHALDRLAPAFTTYEPQPKVEPVPVRRRRIRLGILAGYLAVSAILAPVVAATEVNTKISDKNVVQVKSTLASEQQLLARSAMVANSVTYVGGQHTPQDLEQAESDAAKAHEFNNGVTEAEELLLGAIGLQVAAGAALGTWRRRRSIARGIQRMAGAATGAARSVWAALNEPLPAAPVMIEPIVNNPVSIPPQPVPSASTAEPFPNELQAGVVVRGLDPALAF